MKFAKLIKAIYIFAAVLLVISPVNAEIISGGYTVNSEHYDLIKRVFKFPSAVSVKNDGLDVDIDIPARFYYSDGFFAEDPYKYNTHLATASLCLAMAGFYSNEGGTGKLADYSNKWVNIYQFMQDIGVNAGDIFRNNYNSIQPQTDSIGVTIGSKQLKNGRKLIIISIRGSNYEKEWASNVTLGTSGEAQGFANAADIVFESINNYINNKSLAQEINSGQIDFWISGYSRAGATTNLTAKRLIDKYVTKGGNRVFAYCNEAPQGGITSAENSNSDYTCIHNIINKNDLVPYVAPKNMSFKRYGVDHYIPGSDANYTGGNSDNAFYEADSGQYSTIKNKMRTHLAAINPNIKFSDSFTTYGIDTGVFSFFNDKKFIKTGDFLLMNNFLDPFLDRLIEWSGTNREKYVSNLQTAFRDYMAIIYDASTAQIELLNERLRKLWDIDVGKSDVIGIVWYALGEWDKPDFKHKEYYTNKLINLLEKNKCYDALKLTNSVKDKLMRIDLPKILDFIMTFASVDYRNNLYSTKGLTQILTFANNSKNISMNHYPEVILAWLRAQDSLYDNETSQVTAKNYTPVQISLLNNNSSDVITNIAEIPELFIERGSDPKAALPDKVTAGYTNGTITELAITWDYSKVKYYSPTHKLDGDLWQEVDNLEVALHEPDPLRAIFTGQVNINNSSTDITANVYISGADRLDPPDSSLHDGEYNGPQKVLLSRSNGESNNIYYMISEIVEYEDGSHGGGGNLPKLYIGEITIGEYGLTEEKQYHLIAYTESQEDNTADSETLIWYIKIKPLQSEDLTSEYASNTTAKIFTLSRDFAVCWRVDKENITFSESNNSDSDSEKAGNSIFINSPSESENIAAKIFNFSVVTIAGTTKRGVYQIPVQISTDGGESWLNEKIITV
ncbi:MAG: Ig-like domain-containing protein [Synergistaceae bacterium]|nr:Ig-like domain-containing protein [Synergistaceae bacterium]